MKSSVQLIVVKTLLTIRSDGNRKINIFQRTVYVQRYCL